MRDYKPTFVKPRARGPRFVWFISGLLIPILAILLIQKDIFKSEISNKEIPNEQVSASNTLEVLPNLGKKKLSIETETQMPGQGIYFKLIVGDRDNLDYLFRRNNLNIGDLVNIMKMDLASKYLKIIKPGDKIDIWHDSGKIIRLIKQINISESIRVVKENNSYSAELIEHKIKTRQVQAKGIIKDSLFLSAAEAGISDRLIMNLAGIFAWDIDFVLDIRKGDSFQIIFEEIWRDGILTGEGEILAAEFVNQKEKFQAILFHSPDGTISYFSPDGRNMRKAFLRAPLSFSRISSNFNPNRRHPLLNTIRAHKGVDYAAPSGTPIKAAGDGKVIFRGTKGGYGNTLILQHGSNITTLYAHMKSFNPAAKNGARVTQGSTIGYVGQSGLATGPHLHYEYRKNGSYLNPRTVKLPDAAPIDSALKSDFDRIAIPLMAKLDNSNIVAQANHLIQ
ncbi:MAG: M23 family metallopeptidase [Pseudomonadota bacterium]|nr:M23 family metallopeptidase [Pseudomonadota bacterium]